MVKPPLDKGARNISPRWRRRGASIWPAVAFGVTAVGLIMLVSFRFLLPALDAWNHATKPEQKRLWAYALLLMVVVLLCIVLLLVTSFRIGRFFLPGARQSRQTTQYPDAWAESAKRLKVDPPEEED
jgi:hypothetical protein